MILMGQLVFINFVKVCKLVLMQKIVPRLSEPL